MDAIYDGHHLPWGVRLFVLYLLVLCIFAVVQWSRLGWFLWRTRRGVAKHPEPKPETRQFDFPTQWQLAHIRVVGLNRAVKTTLLLSTLVLLSGAAGVLYGITLSKRVGIAWISGAIYEVLSPVSLGIVVCTVLYASYAVFDNRLQHWKVRWEHSTEPQPPKTALPAETKLPLPPSN